MPPALLTLASKEVKGEAFPPPERQVPGNYLRAVLFHRQKHRVAR